MKKKIKISLIINIIIVVLTIISSIMMFTGFKFMKDTLQVLETSKIGMLKFFTVDSNILMGLIALIFSIEEIKILKDKQKTIQPKYYILKLMSTTAVAVTFFTVFLYLGPISKGGIPTMLQNSNLFFHFFIPLLSMINFICFEKTNEMSFKDSFAGLLPTLIYGLFYFINILIHMKNGSVSTTYDWYWFVQNGVWTTVIVMPIMVLGTYGLSFGLWKLNHR